MIDKIEEFFLKILEKIHLKKYKKMIYNHKIYKQKIETLN